MLAGGVISTTHCRQRRTLNGTNTWRATLNRIRLKVENSFTARGQQGNTNWNIWAHCSKPIHTVNRSTRLSRDCGSPSAVRTDSSPSVSGQTRSDTCITPNVAARMPKTAKGHMRSTTWAARVDLVTAAFGSSNDRHVGKSPYSSHPFRHSVLPNPRPTFSTTV